MSPSRFQQRILVPSAIAPHLEVNLLFGYQRLRRHGRTGRGSVRGGDCLQQASAAAVAVFVFIAVAGVAEEVLTRGLGADAAQVHGEVVAVVREKPLPVQRALVNEVRVVGHPHLLKQWVPVHEVPEVELVHAHEFRVQALVARQRHDGLPVSVHKRRHTFRAPEVRLRHPKHGRNFADRGAAELALQKLHDVDQRFRSQARQLAAAVAEPHDPTVAALRKRPLQQLFHPRDGRHGSVVVREVLQQEFAHHLPLHVRGCLQCFDAPAVRHFALLELQKSLLHTAARQRRFACAGNCRVGGRGAAARSTQRTLLMRRRRRLCPPRR
mmetsp:Transcript_86190/g.167038  ORF Transcript_86190/g.167038 Transcript_86190/m.167038 type:complete len:325 (-) Transcript_86190:126-1100(-)